MKKSSTPLKKTAQKKTSMAKPGKKMKKPATRMESEMMTDATDDIIDLILRDHKPLKQLIKVLKDSDVTFAKKRPAFEKFAPLLTVHAKSEEESLYVQMKKFKDLKVEAYEGDTEHALADQLVHEVKSLSGNGSQKLDEKAQDKWMAKVKVVAELVEHHVEEEETEMLKEVRKEFDKEIRFQIGADYSRLLNFHEAQLKTQQQAEKVENEKQSGKKSGKEINTQHPVWSPNEKLEKHKDFYR